MSTGAGLVGKQMLTSAGSASRKVGAIIRQVWMQGTAHMLQSPGRWEQYPCDHPHGGGRVVLPHRNPPHPDSVLACDTAAVPPSQDDGLIPVISGRRTDSAEEAVAASGGSSLRQRGAGVLNPGADPDVLKWAGQEPPDDAGALAAPPYPHVSCGCPSWLSKHGGGMAHPPCSQCNCLCCSRRGADPAGARQRALGRHRHTQPE